MFRGHIIAEDIIINFRIDEYKLYFFCNERDHIGWQKINALINMGWITLSDNEGNVFKVKVGERFLSPSFEYGFQIVCYMVKFFRDEQAKGDWNFRKIILKSDVLDYFFRANKNFQKEAIYLLENFNNGISDGMEVPEKRPLLHVKFAGEEREVRFNTMIQGCDSPFPYNIRNYVSIDIGGCSEEAIWKIVKTVKLFLMFIAQTQHVNFVDEILLLSGDDINDCNTFLRVHPEENRRINANRVLLYEDISEGLAPLLTMISNEQICFRSLFVADSERITFADIMNICAAFEEQFEQRHKNEYKFKQQKAVKKKMISILQDKRETEFDEKEKPVFDELLEGIKYVKETLKERLQIELDSFVDLYGAEKTKFRFLESYSEMPERIKNSRNALDHGKIDYEFTYGAYWDTVLLRAIVYKMILETASIKDKNKLISCMDKLSKFC